MRIYDILLRPGECGEINTLSPGEAGEVKMRVRIIKPMVTTKYGDFRGGEVINVPVKVGREWCRARIAMEDKSLDRAKETKGDKR